MSTRSPFSTAELLRLPRTSFAYRNANGVWGIRHDGTTHQPTEAEILDKASHIARMNEIAREARYGNAERDYEGI
jgi:hypothetical protein